MGIFYSDNSPGQQAKDQIDRLMSAAFAQNLTAYNQSMRIVWQHKTLSPQQVLDAFGTMAGDLVAKAQAAKEFINAIKPGTITSEAPGDLTINPDGTVTVTMPSSSSATVEEQPSSSSAGDTVSGGAGE